MGLSRSLRWKRRGTKTARGEVLLLGCGGVGKTLLCRQLERHCLGMDLVAVDPKTQPTVGVELLDLRTRTGTLILREVGGSMQQVWHRFFEGADAVVWLADASGGSVIEFYNLVCEASLASKRLLLLFNKRLNGPSHYALLAMYRIRELQARHPERRIHVLFACVLSGEGMDTVVDWLFKPP